LKKFVGGGVESRLSSCIRAGLQECTDTWVVIPSTSLTRPFPGFIALIEKLQKENYVMSSVDAAKYAEEKENAREGFFASASQCIDREDLARTLTGKKRRKAKDDPNKAWTTEVLDSFTWRNLRLTLPGLFGYARQILRSVTNFVSFMHSHTTFIEGHYGADVYNWDFGNESTLGQLGSSE
jgi:hypothetical protein